MQLKISIDIFSGRPNPFMMLEGAEAKTLLEQIKPKSKPTISAANPPPANLGYRGIIIEQLDKKDFISALPFRFTIMPEGLHSKEGFSTAEDTQFEKNILSRLKYFKGAEDVKDFESYLKAEIDRSRFERPLFLKAIKKSYPFVISTPCSCSPPHEIAWWNDGGHIQESNNCYNYACNYRSDTGAQPGYAANLQFSSYTGCTVAAGLRSAREGAIADGLIDAPGADNNCPSNGHLVALVISPFFRDFHFYRKGNDGKWSCKSGQSPATLFDNVGNPISDPRNAARGPYTEFCTFMQVIHGHIKIEGDFQ